MDAAARHGDPGVQHLAMTKLPGSRRDVRVLLTASLAGIAGLAVTGYAFLVPLYRHIVYGTAPSTASSFAGLWGLFALFGSAAGIVAYLQANDPTDRGPRGGHRVAHLISIDASRCPPGEGATEPDRRAA
jgi:hypothetical protein